MRVLSRRSVQSFGAWILALTQCVTLAGCRQATGGGSGGSASVAAASTAGVNLGQILYDLLHHQYEQQGEVGKAAALEARQSDFVAAVNRILPSDVGSSLFPTLQSLLPLVDDGTLERGLTDVDGLISDLLADQATLDALATLLQGAGGGASAGDGRARNQLVSRLLAYPELEPLMRSIMALVREHDGVDDQGAPNGEPDLCGPLRGMLSQALQEFQASPGTGQATHDLLGRLSESLLRDQAMDAFPNLGPAAWSVRLDRHGNPAVAADPATGRLPAPFVDRDGDGAADVGADGRPVDGQGAAIDLPAFAQQGGQAGARDGDGRALLAGRPAYVYYDAKKTLLAEVLLLVGAVIEQDVSADAASVLGALGDRVRHDNRTPADPSDDYETLSPDTPLVDLVHGQMELVRRTPLADLLRGLGAVAKQDPARFAEMLDALVVALAKARTATASAPPPQAGAGQALLRDLLPLVEDALRPRGRGTSAVRALLQAFNSEQRRLRTLPPSFARMMKYHDYRTRAVADATRKSIMQRVLEMMERANGCTVLGASGSGNMADFYLDAMAGNARILGINISINTVNQLVDIGFIRSILCSSIREEDVRALKDFADTGALEAMIPIARVFSLRGETTLLKDIMLGLGRHYDQAMRPTEPTAVVVLESGAVERLFEAIDHMTQVRVPGSNEVVCDVFADTLVALVDSTQPVFDRRNVRKTRLLDLLIEPMDALDARAQQRGVGPQLERLGGALGDVLLRTYRDGQNRERWAWGGLGRSVGDLLATLGDELPAAPADRVTWANDQQRSLERALTGRELVVVCDIVRTIGASSHKATIDRAIVNLFTPRQNPAEDAFGAICALAADALAPKPGRQAPAVDAAALTTVVRWVGRKLDQRTREVEGLIALVRAVLRADDGLLLLRVARNAFDMGPNGTDPTPVEVLTSVFDDVAAQGGAAAPVTSASLAATLRDVQAFLNDPVDGMPAAVARLKARSTR